MPDLSTYDTKGGLQVYGNTLRVGLYAIVTEPTIGMFIGDAVGPDGTVTAAPLIGGYLPSLKDDAANVAQGTGSILGAIVGLLDYHGFPAPYIAAGEVGNGTIAGYAMVADHPEQLFLIKEDGATADLVVADMGLNANLVATHAGNSTSAPYESGQELDSDSHNTTLTLDVRILRPYEEDSIATGASTGNHCRFVVKINAHAYGGEVAGI